MADTQEQPQLSGENMPGSIREAQEALLGIMAPEEVKPEEEEAAPTEEEESIEETQDESLEEESEEELQASESEEESNLEEVEDESEESDYEAEESLYAVKVDGKEHEVTLDELLKGYSRQSDYTRKTQKLAEDFKNLTELEAQWNQEMEATRHERAQYASALENVINSSLSGLKKFDIDWDDLRVNDREEYLLKRDEYREAQEKIQRQQREYGVIQQKQQQEMAQQFQKTKQDEFQKLVQVMPDWGDDQKRAEIGTQVREYALAQGYSSDEINSLVDHRSVMVLLKAKKYDDLANSNVKAKKLKNKPKVIRPGKGKEKSESNKSKRTAQMKRLQASGHVKDATSLFEDFVQL
jgi:hypothetical protein